MKRQKIRQMILQKVIRETAGGSTERNDNVDLVLATFDLAAGETALKAVCLAGCGAFKYW
jgi:flagellar biosynthesis/type III secretory pathway M-ring protein FliF/YscJ